MDYPPLAICLLTYERFQYASVALESVLADLEYAGDLFVHIADDGSEPEHRETLIDIAGRYVHPDHVTVTNSMRGGYGCNYNQAMQVIHPNSGFVLPLEDDWELMAHLNATRLVDAINEMDGMGCIRLGYIGFTHELTGTIRYIAGQTFLELHPDSPERHVFAGHPRIESVEWGRRVGPWEEGLNPGATEFEVAGRPEARQDIYWPLDIPMSASQDANALFAHIGAEQARTDQREE